MEYNKEWRSREKQLRSYAPYNRAKLKTWHTPEEAKSMDEEYNNWRKSFPHGRFNFYKNFDASLERKLLEKFVGKPFYEFEHLWHIRTKQLREKGVNVRLTWIDVKPQEPEDLDRYNKFYIDKDGIIRRNPKYHNWSAKKSIKILEKEVVKWHLHPDIFKYEYGFGYILRHSKIMGILQKYVSNEEFNQIIGGALDDTVYNKIRYRVIYTGLHQALYRYCKEYNAQFAGRRWKCKNWCDYDDFTSLFYKDTSESVYRYIKPGTPEFTKIKAEEQDAKHKEWRDLKKIKSERAKSLLHDIEAKRKAEDQKINDQKIQSHGFDKYESFRGEEYHGGHKKKKS